MSVEIKGTDQDTMGEACARLDISRSSMLRYLKSGFFTPANETKQGRGKVVRYFPEEWYALNEPRLLASRQNGTLPDAANTDDMSPAFQSAAEPINRPENT